MCQKAAAWMSFGTPIVRLAGRSPVVPTRSFSGVVMRRRVMKRRPWFGGIEHKLQLQPETLQSPVRARGRVASLGDVI